MEGLRVLARVIARHYLAHPELYPAPAGNAAGSASAGKEDTGVNAATRAGGSPDHKEATE